jgi:hypothetical protein
LEHASLLLFLNHDLRLIESQLLGLASKNGVHAVAELDEFIRRGRVHGTEASEGYVVCPDFHVVIEVIDSAPAEIDRAHGDAGEDEDW